MLALLYELQKLEAEEAMLLAAQKNCAEYRQVRGLKAEFEKQKEKLLQLQEQLTDQQKQAKNLSREATEIDAKLIQERAAVYDGSVANIREFNARQTQITALEEKSAALMAELKQKQDAFQQGLRQAKQMQQSLAENHHQLSQQYQQYETMRQGWQQELNALAEGKQALLKQVSGEDLRWYEGQKPLFAGLPVAKLFSNHVCDGCRTMVTPALYKRTVQGERTRCEKCGRYLFVE